MKLKFCSFQYIYSEHHFIEVNIKTWSRKLALDFFIGGCWLSDHHRWYPKQVKIMFLWFLVILDPRKWNYLYFKISQELGNYVSYLAETANISNRNCQAMARYRMLSADVKVLTTCLCWLNSTSEKKKLVCSFEIL